MTTRYDHRHRAIPAKYRIVGWTHCVSAQPCSGYSHGGVTIVDECRCGAVRKTESNGCGTGSSGWIEPEPAETDRTVR